MRPPSHSSQRIARLTPLEDVLARIDALAQPVAVRTVELAAACGAILARDVAASAPLPSAAIALRDGWALRSEEASDAGPYSPAPLAGATAIEVGARLPPGADAVAPFDAVTLGNGEPHALAPVACGEGVLAAGADLGAGPILRACERIHGTALAALRIAGVRQVEVRRPRLRIVGARCGSDAVIDAALACIAAAVEDAGAASLLTDASEALEQAIARRDADALIVVGGTGAGRNDGTVAALASLGMVEVHGIALLPGETAALAAVDGCPILAAPGRLDAALAVWQVLGRRLVARLAASAEPEAACGAKLTHKIASPLGMAELVPVRCHSGLATPIASGYVPLCALVQANGWILVPPESEGYRQGHEVVIRPWP